MKNKSVLSLLSGLSMTTALLTVQCVAGTATETAAETVVAPELLIPEISWWAKLVAGIGLGPLAVIGGVLLALLTSGIVIAAVCICDRRKRKKQP